MEGRPLDEQELVDRARGGDAGAYEVLVQTHQSIAYRTAYLITRDAADAEDAAQAAFVKAFYALGRFRPGRPFRPWLLKIVANESRNVRRSAGRKADLVLRLSGRPREDAAPSPEAALLDAEQRHALVDALGTLREQDRLALAYRYLLDLSEEETAAALGCPKGTVKSRVSRALARLRAAAPELPIGGGDA